VTNNLINESDDGGQRYGVRAESPGATYLTSAVRMCNACGWPSTEIRRERRRDRERERERGRERERERERERREGERERERERVAGWRVKIPWSSP